MENHTGYTIMMVTMIMTVMKMTIKIMLMQMMEVITAMKATEKNVIVTSH